MGDNIFSTGMEFLAIAIVVIIILIVIAIFLLPTVIQVFNEFAWILGIGFIFLAFLVLGVLVILMKSLAGMV